MGTYVNYFAGDWISKFRAIVEEVYGMFQKAGIALEKKDIILAGGYVRDTVLDLGPPKDVDIFLPLDAVSEAIAKQGELEAQGLSVIGRCRYDGDRLIFEYKPSPEWPVFQIISTNEKGLVPNLERFDWNICKIGFDWELGSVVGVAGLDRKWLRNRLTTERFEDCRRTLERGFRFEKRFGAKMERVVLYKLAQGLAQEARRVIPKRLLAELDA